MKVSFFRLPLKEKMFFARHMAVMSRSGMQVLDILKALRTQNKSKSYRKMMEHVIMDVRNGQMLHSALGKYPKVFGEFFINLVKIGEVSGTLAQNLEYLADALEKKKEIQSKARGAVAYPFIIMLATFGITGILTFVIFPKILPVFQNLKVDLPITTRIFIAVATFATDHTVIMIGGTIGFFVGFFLLTRIPAVKYRWHWLLLHLPVVGQMVRDYNIVGMTRTLSMLLKSNIKIVQAVRITSQTMSNLVYKKKLLEIATKVGQGETLSENLKKSPKLFSPILVQMISVGETTGSLDETGLYLATFYERELDASTKSFTNIIEPVLLMVMGLIVGFVALAIIQPIYEVSNAVQQ